MSKIRIPAVLSFCCVSSLLLSCRSNDLIPKSEYPEFSIVEGNTVKTRVDEYNKKVEDVDILSPKYLIIGDTVVTYRQSKPHTPPSVTPDLSNIKNNDNPELKGKPLRYIAVGGSLTAGVRDGGYFNEGIQTSYPALVARQMGLQKFEQPLFDASDYNGFGRKVPTSVNYTGGPVPKFKEVKNNSGVDFISTDKFSLRKTIKITDNFAVMNLGTGNEVLVPVNISNIHTTDKEFQKRFMKDYNLSYSQQILSENFDFFSFEAGWTEIWRRYVNKTGGEGPGTKIYVDGINNLTYENVYTNTISEFLHGRMTFLKKLHESGKAKYGYFINLPLVTELPYFNLITRVEVNKVIALYNSEMIFRENVKILPTSEIDSLLSAKVHVSMKKGLSYEKPLTKLSYLTETDQKEIALSTVEFGEEAESLAKSFSFPVVDVNSLYKSILRGNYITDDGVKVDGSYPKGNFFSSDAIYPTAFGQAVIANEVIKTLNNFYNMQIPLIITREYLDN